MIIVSQDRTKTINFDNVEKIEVIADEVILFYKGAELAGTKGTESIGTYATEERAMQVLDEITEVYKDSEIYKYASDSLRETMLGVMEKYGQEVFVYEMPEE